MKYDRHRDRLVDLLLRETLGDETTPDLTDRILQKAFPSRIVPLWMPVAVAAIALLLLGGWLFLPQPYPSPRIDNTLVQRGQMIEAETKARELTLGGYAHVAMHPGSNIIVQGTDKAEQIALQSGKVACRVDRAHGSFAVETEIGTVRVTGTEFSVELQPKTEGGDTMNSMKAGRALMMAVMVTVGAVQVDYDGNEYTLTAGQSRVFGKEAKESQDPPKERLTGKDGEKNAIAKGVLIGTVVEKGDAWVTIRSNNGSVDKYIPEWKGNGPDKRMVRMIAAVNIGDTVKVSWYVDDHLRLKSIGRVETKKLKKSKRNKETKSSAAKDGKKSTTKDGDNAETGNTTTIRDKTSLSKEASVSKDPPSERTTGKDGEANAIAKGIVIGTVTAKTDKSVTIRSLSGKSADYIPEWKGGMPDNGGGPDKRVVAQIQALKVGDSVKAVWYVDDHLRLKSIGKIESKKDRTP